MFVVIEQIALNIIYVNDSNVYPYTTIGTYLFASAIFFICDSHIIDNLIPSHAVSPLELIRTAIAGN